MPWPNATAPSSLSASAASLLWWSPPQGVLHTKRHRLCQPTQVPHRRPFGLQQLRPGMVPLWAPLAEPPTCRHHNRTLPEADPAHGPRPAGRGPKHDPRPLSELRKWGPERELE
uniref:Uncharacterized protein n=1 Tax=Opuntia streptacantha TaxID=393608 RepID=A0A7C9D4K2_OPUST